MPWLGYDYSGNQGVEGKMFLPKFGFRKQKVKLDKNVKKEIGDVVRQELTPFMTREQLEEYLNRIRNDERKMKLWQSLSKQKRIKLLKYVQLKKGEQHGKK